MHALVDAATAASAMAHGHSSRLSDDGIWWLILAYNALAFGLQPLVGLVADGVRLKSPVQSRSVGVASQVAANGWDRRIAISGLVLTALAVAGGSWPWFVAVAAAGLGNALFHVGAGAIVLRRYPGRATEPGIFVAPGALGLAAGIQLGGMGFPHRWLMVVAIACAVVVTVRGWNVVFPGGSRGQAHFSWSAFLQEVASFRRKMSQTPAYERSCTAWLRWCHCWQPSRQESPRHAAVPRWLLAGIVLLLLSVSIRGWLGDALAQGSRGVATAAWGVAAAAFLGKLLGGLLADRWGWRLAGVGALLGLALCLVVFPLNRLAVAAGGMILLQLTMPVTLAGLSVAMPRLPGTAFGLASLALLAPFVLNALGWLSQERPSLLALAALVAALALGFGLTFVFARSWRSNWFLQHASTERPGG